MKILIIGGTQFVGRAIADLALSQGHELTLFHRGKTNPDLFSDVEHIHGDRLDAEALGQLKGRHFDAVVDTCGYFPRALRVSTEALAEAGRYLFISSISVFADSAKIGLIEEDATGALEDETVEEITGETYGPLKALCERVVLDAFADRALVIRPGLIIGPHDPTDRFTYWPRRFHLAREVVLAPDCKTQPVQMIDVRDLAAFCLKMLSDGASGIYSVTGPQSPIALEGAISTIQQAVNPEAEVVWAATDFLKEKGVEPWSDFPFVLPYDGSDNGMLSVDIGKALSAGLKLRPLENTVRDTLEWWQSKGSPTLKVGLSDDNEAELLALYCTHR